MSLFALSLLVLLSGEVAEKEMPDDFLKIESKAWSRWLDEPASTSGWVRVPLRDVLAGEFGPAAFAIDDPRALDTPISFDVDNVSRRVALWRLSRSYAFTIRWAQKHEPRSFLGLSETERREHQVGGVTLTAVTQVMRSDYRTYGELTRAGRVTKEQIIDGVLYYAIDVDRDLNFGYAAAHVNEVQRFKTVLPPKAESSLKKADFEARFLARVRWIEPIGKRKAKAILIGVDPRWLVEIDVLSIEKPGGRIEKKGPLVLAIHSPVRLFQDDARNVPDRAYQFTISGFVSEGRPTHTAASASETKEPKRTE